MADWKRTYGQYFTQANPFQHPAFMEWARSAKLPQSSLLEPFAGTNSLIDHLTGMGLCRNYVAFDIEPGASNVQCRDTLTSFPTGYDVCVTNPPWLAKNLATYRDLPYVAGEYDDLYKFALEKCLENCPWVATLIPESFIRAKLFQERLTNFVSLTSRMFEDTKHPVGLALFEPQSTLDVSLWSNDQYIGELSNIAALRPQPIPDGPTVRFNVPEGNVGLIALDNTVEPSIRFCGIEELEDCEVKSTGRHITKLMVEGGNVLPNRWNDCLGDFREQTQDVLMTCYRGVRKDGRYRRRLDWHLARGIIHHA